MNDRELERLAGKLGSRAAAQVNLDRTAEAVLKRLRAERAVAWWASPAVLRLAAALALTVGAGLFAYRWAGTRSGPPAPAAPVALQPLSTNELEEVLDSLAFRAPNVERVAVGIADLTEDQLRELLRSMEG